jgi:hypothetical protein
MDRLISGVKVGPWDQWFDGKWQNKYIPSGKRTKNYGKSPFLMGKLTISMAIFNSYFDMTRG